MSAIDDAAPTKQEEEEQEGEFNLPWIQYFMPGNATKLITKRCVPYSIYIGFYYVIQLAACIASVNFYGDADRFNSCDVAAGETPMKPEAAMKVYDIPILLMSIYHLIEWIKTTIVLTVACVGINLMWLYYPLVLNTLYGLIATIITMITIFSEEGEACAAAQPQRNLWLKIDVLIFWVTFFVFIGPVLPLRFMGKEKHDELLNAKDDDDEDGSDED